MTYKKYLSDIMKKENIGLLDGKINLIISPTGTGKTTYFFKSLINEYNNKRRIVYLVDTNMLEDAMLEEYGEYMNVYDKQWRTGKVFNGFGFIGTDNNNVIVMSYHKFGFLIQQYPSVLSELDLIVVDEAHNLLRYSSIGINKLKDDYEFATEGNINIASTLLNGCNYLAHNIPNFLKQYNIKWLFMTATPNRVINHIEYQELIHDVLEENTLLGYKNNNIIKFTDVRNGINVLPKNKNNKILAYAQTIKQCKYIESELTAKGFNCITLWSRNNHDYPMSKEQLLAREYIIKNKKLPISIDVLIINDAYETGWNLDDINVNTVICNTSNADTITQVRGRIRHDIDTLLHRDNTTQIKIDTVPYEFLNVDLYKCDIIHLEKHYNMYDAYGRLIKWKRIKNMILNTNKYKITTVRKMINGKRHTVNIINNIHK